MPQIQEQISEMKAKLKTTTKEFTTGMCKPVEKILTSQFKTARGTCTRTYRSINKDFDHFCSLPILHRYPSVHGYDTCGTVMTNIKHFPQALI